MSASYGNIGQGVSSDGAAYAQDTPDNAHVAIAVVFSNHPNYLDPNVIIGGFMSHFFFTVPLALVVKKYLAATR
ncbi:MAG: hypothetical protein JO227_21620 [Acetobacteraceae bacterium]|nr:hypothetical protein [Acetobacteraceae bacterium]